MQDLSDDLTELYVLQDECAERRERASWLMVKANETADAGHCRSYEIAAAEFDRCDHRLAEINRRIDEIEEQIAFDEMRELRRGYYGSVL